MTAMITRLSHTAIWVVDQEAALDFYTRKPSFHTSLRDPTERSDA
jgi:catechol 2,3-dioxygenase-like lactoylglutathione lyase family enzyme